MQITKWRGGLDGQTLMPTGNVNLGYTLISLEFPISRTYTTTAYGYYTPGDTVETFNLYRNNSLEVTLDGELLDTAADIIFSTSNTFFIQAHKQKVGIISISYLPLATAYYFGDSRSTMGAGATYSMAPFKIIHFTNLMDAINNMLDTLDIEKPRWSSGNESFYETTVEGWCATSTLINELETEINRLIIALSSITYVPLTAVSYTKERLNAKVIEQIRNHINILESLF